MCGIAGIVSREPLNSQHLDQLARMSQAMTHRGPDSAGEFHAERVAMAVRRLSIIDLTSGAQPLYDEDNSLVLIANGEIYNYIELRNQLRDRGHTFKTGSDCEVILHLYQEQGSKCVHALRGMFAFALWDKRKRTLLLARDRMGEKPLYLYEQDGLLVFGSELKTLLHSGLVPFRLEPSAVDHFFHYQYVPEPMTPVQGVRKLGAGCTMTVALDHWTVEESCYWRMEDAPPLEGDPAQRIRAELESISELVIRSDVPVGIALSGGLDSSAIAALAAKKYPGVMHAFSVGYAERSHTDERSQAEALASYLRLPFHDIELSTPEIVESFPDLIRWQDDPIADISGFGYWALAKAAKEQGVPVLLQGQGGDELFWGYSWVTAAARQSRRKSLIPTSEKPRFGEYLELYWPRTWPRRAPLDWLTSLAGLRSSLTYYQRDRISPRERLVFYDLNEHFRAAARSASSVYHPRFRDSLSDVTPYDIFTVPLPWPQIDIALTRLICQTYLSENGIAQGDRLSMAASVELRLPLVDYRLVETVIGLRKVHSDVGLPPKTWLKQATEDVVPEWVRKRPKRGFQPPVRAWHRAIFARYGHLLRDGALNQLGVLTPRATEHLAKGSFPLTQTMSPAFNALVLELWCRQCLDQAPALSPDSRRASAPSPAARRARAAAPAVKLTPRKVLHSLIWTRRHHSRQMSVPEFEFMRQFLRDDDLAIDVGAHGGSWTHVLSEALPRGHVYAFEALPYYADVLRLTSRLNGWHNVTIINSAVTDAPRTATIVYRDSDGKKLTGKTHVLGTGDGGGKSVQVEGVTLDSYMDQLDPGRVRFLKCDVEGFELPVLRGASNLIQTHHPLLWCEVWTEYTQRYNYTPADLFAFLEGFGYRLYMLDLEHGWSRTDSQSYRGWGDVLAAPEAVDVPLAEPPNAHALPTRLGNPTQASPSS